MTPDLIREAAHDYLAQREAVGEASAAERRHVNGFVDYLLTVESMEDATIGDGLYAADLPRTEADSYDDDDC